MLIWIKSLARTCHSESCILWLKKWNDLNNGLELLVKTPEHPTSRKSGSQNVHTRGIGTACHFSPTCVRSISWGWRSRVFTASNSWPGVLVHCLSALQSVYFIYVLVLPFSPEEQEEEARHVLAHTTPRAMLACLRSTHGALMHLTFVQ